MAYNKNIANDIRKLLMPYGNIIEEKKMFGGLSFLYNGKMSIGVVKNELAVRVISNKMRFELEKPNVRSMDFTKKPMKEFIFVLPKENESMKYWIELGIEHAKLNS